MKITTVAISLTMGGSPRINHIKVRGIITTKIIERMIIQVHLSNTALDIFTLKLILNIYLCFLKRLKLM